MQLLGDVARGLEKMNKCSFLSFFFPSVVPLREEKRCGSVEMQTRGVVAAGV